MKTKLRNPLLLLMMAALAAGCASHPARVVLAPVGPVRPHAAASAALNPDRQGTLVVYSAFDDNPDFNRRDAYYQRAYTDYVLRTGTGHWLRRVHNDSGTILLAPATVDLPAGRYLVQADANGLGEVTVPVVIAPHQLTTVHLEADASSVPPAQSGG